MRYILKNEGRNTLSRRKSRLKMRGEIYLGRKNQMQGSDEKDRRCNLERRKNYK